MSGLRDALEQAIDSSSETETTEVAEIPAPPGQEQEVVDTGTETTGTETLEVEDTKTTEQTAPETKPEGEPAPSETQEQQAARHRVDRAPSSWRSEAKQAWGQLPLNVRQEIYRREQDINRTLNESAQSRQFADQFNQVVAPYMARVNAAGVSPVQAAAELFKADYILSTGTTRQKAEYMTYLISNYGVDVAALDEALVAAAGGGSKQPDIESLVTQRVQQALQPFLQQQNQQEEQIRNEAITTVEQMSLDPKYPYFEDVREDMADLIELHAKRGATLSLPDAYRIAVVANPTVSQQVGKQDAHKAAQLSKSAASSVTGSPLSPVVKQVNPASPSVRDAINQAIEGL